MKSERPVNPHDDKAGDTEEIVRFLPRLRLNRPIAAVDVGGNSLEVIILHPDKSLETARYPLISGKGIGETGRITPEAEAVFKDAVTQAKSLLDRHRVNTSDIKAVATSGLRDAQNGQAMADAANQLGIPLHIIDGLEEAALLYPSVLAKQRRYGTRKNLVLEIGGGSTELIPGRGPYQAQRDLIRVLHLGTGRLGMKDFRESADVQRVRQCIHPAIVEAVGKEVVKACQGRPVFLKNALEFNALRELHLQDTGEDILQSGLTHAMVKHDLSSEGRQRVAQALADGKFPGLQYANKLMTKLVVIDEMLSHLGLKTVTFGPSWGLKVGVLESLMQDIKASG